MLRRLSFAFTIACLLAVSAEAQPVTISGFVEDAQSRERLIAATVFDAGRSIGTVTNRYGFFSLTLPAPGESALVLRLIDYAPDTLRLVVRRDTSLVLHLRPDDVQADELTVEGERDRIEQTTRMSVSEIPVDQIERLPMLLGEPDVLKALQLLPGVQEGTEGTSGLYVRGGGADQNLILLDGVPVYNASHLFGFFSVFAPDAVQRVELTKGGFPARYGGRLSSVIDVAMREGNRERFAGAGSVGLISSHLTVEGPLAQGRASFLVTGRRTYVDLIARPFIPEDERFGYRFYDLNAKVNATLTPNDRVYLSVYAGDDRFAAASEDTDRGTKERTDGAFGWGNVTGALRLNHVFSPRLFANLTATLSRYGFDVDMREETRTATETEGYAMRYRSSIRDLGVRVDFDYVPSPLHYVRAGMSITQHHFSPGAFSGDLDNADPSTRALSQPDATGLDLTVYAEDDFHLLRVLTVNVGVHASAYRTYRQAFASVEPRLAARLLVTNDMALKASFVTMTQYLHLLTNVGIGLPTDLWVPATEGVPPQRAWQAALGLARTWGPFEVSVEGYVKQLRNLVQYGEGAGFFLPGSDWQNEVVTGGEGCAYGVETFVQRKAGRTTGWLGYTLAWADRRFDDVNRGERFPYRYDRRHDLSAVMMHTVSRRLDVSATWVYGTGIAATVARATYYLPNAAISPSAYGFDGTATYYGPTNGYRMPAYHRLDLGAQWYFRRGRRERVLNLSIYNAYNRKNVLYATTEAYDGCTDTGPCAYKMTGIAPFRLIPAFSFRFAF
ncbi:MAG: TonB-dependent receptor [Bacteroidetes bacterium]|nr:TonB-dependent receptor [Bacteroidota bacterium]